MGNLEQKYIEGFVKRAKEKGFTDNQTVLLFKKSFNQIENFTHYNDPNVDPKGMVELGKKYVDPAVFSKATTTAFDTIKHLPSTQNVHRYLGMPPDVDKPWNLGSKYNQDTGRPFSNFFGGRFSKNTPPSLQQTPLTNSIRDWKRGLHGAENLDEEHFLKDNPNIQDREEVHRIFPFITQNYGESTTTA